MHWKWYVSGFNDDNRITITCPETTAVLTVHGVSTDGGYYNDIIDEYGSPHMTAWIKSQHGAVTKAQAPDNSSHHSDDMYNDSVTTKGIRACSLNWIGCKWNG